MVLIRISGAKLAIFSFPCTKITPLFCTQDLISRFFAEKGKAGRPRKAAPLRIISTATTLQQRRTCLLDSYALAVDDIDATTQHLADLAAIEVEDLSIAFS